MFRKFALALIATSMLAAPALAKSVKNVSEPALVTSQALAANAAEPRGKTVRTGKKHRMHVSHRHHRHPVFAGKHRGHVVVAKHGHIRFVGKHNGHVKHLATVRTSKTLKITKTFKHRAHLHRVVKVKKVRHNRTALRTHMTIRHG